MCIPGMSAIELDDAVPESSPAVSAETAAATAIATARMPRRMPPCLRVSARTNDDVDRDGDEEQREIGVREVEQLQRVLGGRLAEQRDRGEHKHHAEQERGDPVDPSDAAHRHEGEAHDNGDDRVDEDLAG